MFKKRVIILFFTLFLFNLYSEDSKNISDKKYIDEAYEKDISTFFVDGIIESDEKTIDFTLYKEKNKFNKYNFSLLIDSNIYKIISKKNSTNYYLNDKEIDKNYKIEELGIPLSILNYSLINRDYIIISKSNKTKYKNIPCNKLLIKEKDIIEETAPVIENTESAIDPDPAEITSSEESITDSLKTLDNDVTFEEDQPVIINEKKIEYEEAMFPKVIYYLADKTSTILRKEFYLEKDNKLPDYVISAENVLFIKGNYMETIFNIIDIKDKNITFKYNIETILLEKKLIDKKFNKMIFFNGAI